MSVRLIRQFIQLESSGGIVLFVAALFAFIIDNTSLAPYYNAIFNTPLQFLAGSFEVKKTLLGLTNDGFMTVFFLLVGLEIKREIVSGELNSISKALLPAIAAIGGMIVPAAFYIAINFHDPVAFKGWAIPTATDTAFSLAVLTLLGSRIPVGLKIFLMALAIFDDIGAIIIMAVFYSSGIAWQLLFFSTLLFLVLILLNYYNIQNIKLYLLVGFLIWVCMLKSGVHATLTGIILAFTIPMTHGGDAEQSPLRILEDRLHPWVAFGVLPLFAFANAGVSFTGITWHHFFTPISAGITLGLLLGKQCGIWGATMLAVKSGLSEMPKGITGLGLYGMSLTAGIGFTMSLFIGTLAFHSAGPYAALIRLGVISGSLVSGFLGYLVLRLAYSRSYPYSRLHSRSH